MWGETRGRPHREETTPAQESCAAPEKQLRRRWERRRSGRNGICGERRGDVLTEKRPRPQRNLAQRPRNSYAAGGSGGVAGETGYVGRDAGTSSPRRDHAPRGILRSARETATPPVGAAA